MCIYKLVFYEDTIPKKKKKISEPTWQLDGEGDYIGTNRYIENKGKSEQRQECTKAEPEQLRNCRKITDATSLEESPEIQRKRR